MVECLHGEIRPAMVAAIRQLRDDYATGLLTNNFLTGTPEWSRGSASPILDLFDVVVSRR